MTEQFFDVEDKVEEKKPLRQPQFMGLSGMIILWKNLRVENL